MTIGQVIGRIKIHEDLDVGNVMGIMNKNVHEPRISPKDDDDDSLFDDLLDSVLRIYENERGDHGEDGEYGDYDKDKFDFYRRNLHERSL